MESNKNEQILINDTGLTSGKIETKRTHAMILMAVVAGIGVILGVTGMVIGLQKTDKVKDLESLLAEKTENSENTSDGVENCPQVPTDTEEVKQEQDNSVASDVTLAKDYIYIGEWGKKFKIPKDLVTVSFMYDGAHDTLCVNGVKYIEGGMHYFPGFADIAQGDGGVQCLGMMSRELSSGEFYYSHPQALYGEEDEAEWETASTNLVQELLTKNMEDF